MKKRMALFCTFLLLVTALTACGSAGKEAEVPPLTEVEAMTAEEAAEALSASAGRTFWTPGASPRTCLTPCPRRTWTSTTPPPWAAGWLSDTTPLTSRTQTPI